MSILCGCYIFKLPLPTEFLSYTGHFTNNYERFIFVHRWIVSVGILPRIETFYSPIVK